MTLTNTPTTTTNNPQLELLPLAHPLNIFDALDSNNNEMMLTKPQQLLPTILSWNYYLWPIPSTHLMLLMAITLRWRWQTPQQPLPTILSWNYYLQSTPSTHLMLLTAITMRWPQPQHKQQFTPIFSSLLWFSGPTLVTQHLQTNKTCKVLIILSSCKKIDCQTGKQGMSTSTCCTYSVSFLRQVFIFYWGYSRPRLWYIFNSHLCTRDREAIQYDSSSDTG